MALRRLKRGEPVAEIVKGQKQPCVFCNRNVDDEVTYGKLYAIGDIQCHYFCVLLSCCLVQKANDTVGLFGFLYQDILAEVARAKKHKCSYCLRGGASLGCCFPQCRKQFHLPCGRERNVVSLFYDNYRSYCKLHAPKQNIPENIMAKARLRKKFATKGSARQNTIEVPPDLEAVCVICYEEVEGYPTTETFWPPCCAKDAWFHRTCLQRMSLSAGMHYLKCPLCNDKENFYKAVKSQGYYIPDRDAAWELEQNAFSGLYERPVVCNAVECQCDAGRSHDSENGPWEIKLCILCGSSGIHVQCQKAGDGVNASGRFVCATCQPAAPADLDSLADSLEAVILAEQSRNETRRRRGPIMPSRMSLRRTKGQTPAIATSSSDMRSNVASDEIKETSSLVQARQELNLKTPKRSTLSPEELKISTPITSPTKLLELCLNDRSKCTDTRMALDRNVIEEARRKLSRPRPLSQKTRIVNKIIDEFMNNKKSALKDRCSSERITEFNAKLSEPLTEDQKLLGSSENEIDKNINTKNKDTPIAINRDTQSHNSDINVEVNPNTVHRKETPENGVFVKASSIIELAVDNCMNRKIYLPNKLTLDDNINELNAEDNLQVITPKISEHEQSVCKAEVIFDEIDLDSKNEESGRLVNNNIINEMNLKLNEVGDIEFANAKESHTESLIKGVDDHNEEDLFKNSNGVQDIRNLNEDEQKQLEQNLQDEVYDIKSAIAKESRIKSLINVVDNICNKGNVFKNLNEDVQKQLQQDLQNEVCAIESAMGKESQTESVMNVVEDICNKENVFKNSNYKNLNEDVQKQLQQDLQNEVCAIESAMGKESQTESVMNVVDDICNKENVFKDSNYKNLNEVGQKQLQKDLQNEVCAIESAIAKESHTKSLMNVVDDICNKEKVFKNSNDYKNLTEHMDSHMESLMKVVDDKCNKENVFKHSDDNRNLNVDVQKQLEQDLQVFSSPKNLKTIHIENDSSVEISKDDQTINIDVVKIENSTTDNFKLPLMSPVKNKKCFIKFSVTDKEVLQNTNFNLDLESFKNQYLSEVDGERAKNKQSDNINTDVGINRRNLRKRKLKMNMKKCKKRKVVTKNSNIDNTNTSKEICVDSPLDYDELKMQKQTIDNTSTHNETCLKTLKDNNEVKSEIKKEDKTSFDIDNVDITKDNKQKNKRQKCIVIKDKRPKRKVTKANDTSVKVSLRNRDDVQLAIDTNKSNRTDRKLKTRLSIRNKKLEVKIKWREERFNLRITETKRRKRLVNNKSFKQYVLKYNINEKSFIAKPESEITPPKRKYIKQEKPHDKLVQTSIQSFFKKVP